MPSNDTPKPLPEFPTDHQTIVTANLQAPKHSMTVRRQYRALRQIIARAQLPEVVLCQEALPGLKVPHGYRLAFFPYREQAILVRADVELEGFGGVRAHGGRKAQWPARWITSVRVRGVEVFNVHVNNRIDAGGRAIEPQSERTRDAFRNIYLAGLLATRSTTNHVIVAGDWNVDARNDQRVQDPDFPSVQMFKAHLAECDRVDGGTLPGGRQVDRVFYRGLEPVLTRALPRPRGLGWRCDHKPVMARFRIV